MMAGQLLSFIDEILARLLPSDTKASAKRRSFFSALVHVHVLHGEIGIACRHMECPVFESTLHVCAARGSLSAADASYPLNDAKLFGELRIVPEIYA
jgi:hypothetical protein